MSPRIAVTVLCSAVCSALVLTGCGGDSEADTAPTQTVTVTATPAPTTPPIEEPTQESAQTPEDIAVQAIQGLRTFSTMPDGAARGLMEKVCQALYLTNGESVTPDDFTYAEAFLDGTGASTQEKAVVIRASTVACPDALTAVAQHYGKQG